jgi:hypothetical protein
MHDCSKQVTGYHDDEVTLLQKERDEMRDRRNAPADARNHPPREAVTGARDAHRSGSTRR